MIGIVTALVIIASIILAFFVLVQNPKGGGLSGAFGNASTQVMGVKQSGDIMEKGTWIMIASIGLLCIISVSFMTKPQQANDNGGKSAQQKSAPAKKGK